MNHRNPPRNNPARMLDAPGTLAGMDVASLSDDDLLKMKQDLQAQFSTRKSQIEERKMEVGERLDSAEWREYTSWRGRASSLLSLLEKEIANRRTARRAADGASLKGSMSPKVRVSVANLAAWILAEKVLDGDDMSKETIADSVTLASTCLTSVWDYLDTSQTIAEDTPLSNRLSAEVSPGGKR